MQITWTRQDKIFIGDLIDVSESAADYNITNPLALSWKLAQMCELTQRKYGVNVLASLCSLIGQVEQPIDDGQILVTYIPELRDHVCIEVSATGILRELSAYLPQELHIPSPTLG